MTTMKRMILLAGINVALASAMLASGADAQTTFKGCCRKEAGTSNKFCCTDCECDAKTCSASTDCKPADE